MHSSSVAKHRSRSLLARPRSGIHLAQLLNSKFSAKCCVHFTLPPPSSFRRILVREQLARRRYAPVADVHPPFEPGGCFSTHSELHLCAGSPATYTPERHSVQSELDSWWRSNDDTAQSCSKASSPDPVLSLDPGLGLYTSGLVRKRH